jgi:hypothetical protein
LGKRNITRKSKWLIAERSRTVALLAEISKKEKVRSDIEDAPTYNVHRANSQNAFELVHSNGFNSAISYRKEEGRLEN